MSCLGTRVFQCVRKETNIFIYLNCYRYIVIVNFFFFLSRIVALFLKDAIVKRGREKLASYNTIFAEQHMFVAGGNWGGGRGGRRGGEG